MAAQEGGPPIVSTTVGKKPQGKAKTEKGLPGVEELMGNAQRAQPKSTVRDPLYQDFGMKKPEGTGQLIRPQRALPTEGFCPYSGHCGSWRRDQILSKIETAGVVLCAWAGGGGPRSSNINHLHLSHRT